MGTQLSYRNANPYARLPEAMPVLRRTDLRETRLRWAVASVRVVPRRKGRAGRMETPRLCRLRWRTLSDRPYDLDHLRPVALRVNRVRDLGAGVVERDELCRFAGHQSFVCPRTCPWCLGLIPGFYCSPFLFAPACLSECPSSVGRRVRFPIYPYSGFIRFIFIMTRDDGIAS